MLLADYLILDPARKLNVIGGGVTVAGSNPLTGLTAPIAVFVSVAVPTTFYDAECSIELSLEASDGSLVSVPVPQSESQPLQVTQTVTFTEPEVLVEGVPKGFLRSRGLLAISFPTGLPLPPGNGYKWRLKIDDETRDDWAEEFIVVSQEPTSARFAGPIPSRPPN